MLVGDDEAWLIYGIASHKATHQIADELFDDYIIVPDDLLFFLAAILRFFFLDRDFSLLQDGYLIERNVWCQLVFQTIDMNELLVESLFVLMKAKEHGSPFLLIDIYSP